MQPNAQMDTKVQNQKQTNRRTDTKIQKNRATNIQIDTRVQVYRDKQTNGQKHKDKM